MPIRHSGARSDEDTEIERERERESERECYFQRAHAHRKTVDKHFHMSGMSWQCCCAFFTEPALLEAPGFTSGHPTVDGLNFAPLRINMLNFGMECA